MLATIWMCTHEWSLISIRTTAFTFATCHHPLSCLSALTRSSSVRSFRLPRDRDVDAHLLDRLRGREARLALRLLGDRLLDPLLRRGGSKSVMSAPRRCARTCRAAPGCGSRAGGHRSRTPRTEKAPRGTPSRASAERAAVADRRAVVCVDHLDPRAPSSRTSGFAKRSGPCRRSPPLRTKGGGSASSASSGCARGDQHPPRPRSRRRSTRGSRRRAGAPRRRPQLASVEIVALVTI